MRSAATNYVKVWCSEPAWLDGRGLEHPGSITQDVRCFDANDHRAVAIAVQWAERESRRLAELGRDARIAVWNRLAQRPSWPTVGTRREWN